MKIEKKSRTVLYVIDTLATGGAEKSLLEISSGLAIFTPLVCVILTRNADLKDEFLKRQIKIFFLDVTSRLWWVEGVIKLRKIIKSVRPDIVHATLFKSELITRIALLGTGIPHVGSFVNDSYSAHRYKLQSPIRNLKLNIVRIVDLVTARSVTHFISISKTVAETNARALFVGKKKITCIYRGRNLERFRVAHPPEEKLPFVFLVVARLLRRKGYLELFQAVQRLSVKNYDFKVKIAGDGSDFDLFVQTVLKLSIQSKVEFLMNRTDVPDLLAASHCFVFPSHYEGQGGSLVEAMLAAKPIIASDIPVFREQITDGQTGKFFQVFNERDLCDKMEWMLQNYAEAVTMGLKARETAIARFDVTNTVRLHEALYLKLLAETSK